MQKPYHRYSVLQDIANMHDKTPSPHLPFYSLKHHNKNRKVRRGLLIAIIFNLFYIKYTDIKTILLMHLN